MNRVRRSCHVGVRSPDHEWSRGSILYSDLIREETVVVGRRRRGWRPPSTDLASASAPVLVTPATVKRTNTRPASGSVVT